MMQHFTAAGALLAARQIELCLWINMPIWNVRNEVVKIHKSQEVLKMLSLYVQIFFTPVKNILIYHLKLFCRNICFSLWKVSFVPLGGGGGAVIHFVLQTIPELKVMRIKIKWTCCPNTTADNSFPEDNGQSMHRYDVYAAWTVSESFFFC
jgi:hypothetical protein